jgi:hypothetical protein
MGGPGSRAAARLGAIVLGLAACAAEVGRSTEPLPPAGNRPVIASFTATPSTVASGGASTLAWSVTGATSVSIAPGPGTVTGASVQVSPATSTTYTLSAANAAGTSTAQAMVAVTGGSGQLCNGKPCNAIPAGLLDPDRTTTWSPGILADGQLGLPLGADRLPVRTTRCSYAPAPGTNTLTTAGVNGCPEGTVVQLAAGTYTVSATVALTRGVVVRGAGSQGASQGGTTIVRTGGGSVLAIGTTQDGACYAWGSYAEAPADLAADAVKETTLVRVGTSAARFRAGDLALLDQLDDADVVVGDGTYFKRAPNRGVSERVEVAAVDAGAGTVTLRTPLHWTFRAGSPYLAQLTRVTAPVVRWAGIEAVLLQGGTNPGYDGQMAGGIDVSNAAYCWVKDVQTDGTIAGIHVALRGTYRCVVRDGYFHHSANYGFGADCYGVVVGCGSADGLVENNVVRYMNKPLQLSNSGGGNVLGYNYADNAWATPPSFQEVAIDSHCAYPHMELVEGNYAPHIGLPDTHGATGDVTFFRNFASSQFAYPAVANSTAQQTGDVQALSLCTSCKHMTVVGNVLGPALGTDPRSAVTVSQYLCPNGNGKDNCILSFGDQGTASPAYATVRLHGNWDTVNRAVRWDPTVAPRELPGSLYLSERPAWWPAGSPFPWAGPDLTPMVNTLPAKARSDGMR